MEPVWQQRILGIAEHLPDIGRVFLTGIKIGIIANLYRKLHLNILYAAYDGRAVLGIVAQLRILFVKNVGDTVPDQSPGLFSVGDEIVQRILHEHVVGKFDSFKIPQVLKRAQIDGIIANPGANGNHIVFGEEYAEGNVLNGKIAVSRYVEPRLPGRIIRGNWHYFLDLFCG